MKRLSNRATALRRVLMLSVCVAALLAAMTASASADAFGQLQRWGGQGTAAGQFTFSTGFGVDNSDDSVFVLDNTEAFDQYRLQKLSRSGAPLGSVLIPKGSTLGLLGIAVDSDLDRLYLLAFDTGTTRATKLLVYSTTPDGSGRLVAPADLPAGELPVPTGTDAIAEPAQIALDARTHDLIVSGRRGARLVLQRISSAGVALDRFDDSDTRVPLTAVQLAGLAVGGRDDSVYVSTAYPQGVYEVNSTLDTVTVLDIDTPRAAERWFSPGATAGYEATGLTAGPQLAVDADDTLWWVEAIRDPSGETAGSALLRGWSATTGRTVKAYGGGTASCHIDTSISAVALGGSGTAFVIEHSPFDVYPAPYSERVSQFGAGGSGCPIPSASFSVNGRAEAAVTVTKGGTIALDASGSALAGTTPTEVSWDLDGSGRFETSSGTSLRLSHRFVRAGRFTVSLRIAVSGSISGDPEVVTRAVTVVSPAPTASFTAAPRTVAPGGTITFDATESVDPAGTDDARPTNRLARYHWEFGDGTTQDTTTPAASHAYPNAAADAVARTVRLTVTSRDGIDSAAVSQTVTVQGTPGPPPPPSCANTPALCPPPPVPTCADTPALCPPRPAPVVAPKVAVRGARATSAGAVALTLACPAGTVACNGAVALTATVRVAGRRGRRARTQVVALGSASFTVTAGGSRAVTVRLSSAGRKLLAKSRRLKIALRATTRAGSSSATTTASATITLPRRARRAKK